MSDNSVSVVPKKSNYPDKEKKAQEILDWLISLDIVMAKKTDCVLGSPFGYEFSKGAIKITNYPQDVPFKMRTNGLEIITSRHIFHTGGNGMESIICPACNQNLVDGDWDLLDEWYEQTNDIVTCSLCQAKSGIHDFTFEPAMGFSDLGFSFWNLPDLTEEFINELKKKLNTEVTIVYTHL